MVCAEVRAVDRSGSQPGYSRSPWFRRREEPSDLGEAAGIDGHRRVRLHGYSELFLRGRWFKLSTAFNIELCERFGTKALEFDGTDDALMHPFDESGNRHMEYVKQRGSFDDLPLDMIFASFAEIYPTMGFGGAGAAAAGDEVFDSPQ